MSGRVRPCLMAGGLALAMLLALFAARAATPDAETVRLGGSTSALGTMRQLGQAFERAHPGARIAVIDGLNSGGAIRAVVAGTVDVAASSRPLSDLERAQGLHAVEYGRSPSVFVTAAATPLDSLTRAQVADLYAGRQPRWSDGTRVRLVLTPADDPDTALLKRLSPAVAAAVDTAVARPGMVVDASDGVRADLIERTPGAVGLSMLSLIQSEQRPLKTLPLDGVEPSAAAIADGRYPLYKTFYLATPARPAPLVDRFAAFVRSPEGRAILERNGHWVVP